MWDSFHSLSAYCQSLLTQDSKMFFLISCQIIWRILVPWSELSIPQNCVFKHNFDIGTMQTESVPHPWSPYRLRVRIILSDNKVQVQDENILIYQNTLLSCGDNFMNFRASCFANDSPIYPSLSGITAVTGQYASTCSSVSEVLHRRSFRLNT